MTTTESDRSAARTPLNAPRRGDVHDWSATLIPTTRDAPADAELPSHVFLVRAGYIRRVGAGIYNYLPLGWRVLRKISQIVREEMDAAGASEMLMPALEPVELFKGTKRDVDYGDLLFKVEDRHGRTAALAPTHEEVITDLMCASLTSYKQFPLNLYQIQTKFRDEFRPRAGLLRGREFVMKDAYSFHLEIEGDAGLNTTYDKMYDAYTKIFSRCGLDFSAVEAEAGPIGGSASHEFMVNCESGEDTILVCPDSGYAANVEKAEIGERSFRFEGAGSSLEERHTPNMPGIELVAEHLGTNAAGMLKTVVFQTVEDAPRWVLAVVRGDHEVNEGKVREAAGTGVVLADQKEAEAAGFAIGYVSPSIASKHANALVLVDHDATMGSWATGADKKDHHVIGWEWSRDSGLVDDALKNDGASSDGRIRVAEIRNAEVGDPSPRSAGAILEARRGIEVGHIFKLGCKYSDAMGLSVLDRDQKKRSVIMGCYGIGVSRTLAACVEMAHDNGGIVWPAPIAPYHVQIVVLKPKESETIAHARKLADDLAARGLDVLIDDRDERPGPKFKDADLVGIPVRLTISPKTMEQDAVEFKRRTDTGKGELVAANEVLDLVESTVAGGFA